MAKARVTVTCPGCGEEWTWSVTCYNRREADEWEAKHEGEERECQSCYRERRIAEAKEAGAKAAGDAAERAKAAGKELVPLRGSEKQVSWAEGIRAKVALEVLSMPGTARPELWDVLNLVPEAEWWIEHRHFGAERVLTAIWNANKFDCVEIMRRADAAASAKTDVE